MNKLNFNIVIFKAIFNQFCDCIKLNQFNIQILFYITNKKSKAYHNKIIHSKCKY